MITQVPRDVTTMQVPCPYIYVNKKRCHGHIESIHQRRGQTSRYWWFKDGQWYCNISRANPLSYLLECSSPHHHRISFQSTELPTVIRDLLENVRV